MCRRCVVHVGGNGGSDDGCYFYLLCNHNNLQLAILT